MDDNPDLPDEERGLYAKYRVVKITDPQLTYTALLYRPGKDEEPKFAEEVTDPCFVMKFDDPAAQDALWVYANSVKKKYPKLAADVKEQITQAVERQQAFLAELDEIERQGRFHAGVDDGPSLKELVTRPDAASRYLEGLEAPFSDQERDPRIVETNEGGPASVRRLDGEICDWSGKPHLREHDDRMVNGCGWRTLHTYSPGAWPVEKEQPDWELLEEEVTGHTMMHGVKHADGRNCAYHSRLQSWTFDGLYRCLRTDHPTLPGA